MSAIPIHVQGEQVLENGACIPPTASTLSGFRKWATSDEFPTRGRFSFLAGELYVDLSMEELLFHNPIKVAVGRILSQIVDEYDMGVFVSDRGLLTNLGVGLSHEPDAAFVSWGTLESGRARYVRKKNRADQAKEIEGTVDWVMEIVGESSVQKDQLLLRQIYHAAKIPEYWLIDGRKPEPQFEILHRTAKQYTPANQRGEWQYSSVFDRHFRLVATKRRLGFWKYDLQVKK
jgi:Uma2 family endonuclease